MNQRPMGVTILAIFAFIAGGLGILGSLALLGVGALFSAYAGGGGLAFIFGIVALLLSFLYLYIGYGFWTLKRTAWSLGLVVFGAGILIDVIETALGYGAWSSVIFTIIINGIVLYYLLTPAVKAAFGVTGDLQTAVMSGLPMGGGAAAGSAAAASPAATPAETYTPPPAPAAAPEPPAAPPPATSSWDAPSDTSSGGGESHDGGEGDTA